MTWSILCTGEITFNDFNDFNDFGEKPQDDIVQNQEVVADAADEESILDRDEKEAQRSQSGFIYCVTNPCMPNLLKIGITIDLKIRMARLYSTGVPFPFKIEFAKFIESPMTPREAETILHAIFAPQRVNLKREFFRVPKECVKAAFSLLQGEDEDVHSIQYGPFDRGALDSHNESFPFHGNLGEVSACSFSPITNGCYMYHRNT